MDIATLLGLIAGIAIIAAAMLSGASIGTFANLPGVLIVLGGTLAATLIKFPLTDWARAFATAVRTAFLDRNDKPGELVREVDRVAGMVRGKGFLALERAQVRNIFFQKGIELCADGHAPDFIENVLRQEMEHEIERLELGERIFRAMGDAAPAFGLVGTLVGLVQMLADMKDADSLGPAMAVALLTTLYGALIANLIALPIADKLELRAGQQRSNMRLVIDGVLAIRAGQNPRVMDELLDTYLPPKTRAALRAEDAGTRQAGTS